MSKIALSPNASGTGTLTIAAPDTSTSRTLTLPDETGTILTSSSSLAAANITGELALTGTPVEDVYAITGTSVALDPANGSIQTHTLSGATTYTDGFSAGQAVTLMIDDGTAATITWPTMTWVNNAAVAPTLATTGYTVVALWKVSTVLYGALVGDGT